MAEALIDVVARLTSIPKGDRYEIGPTIFAKRPFERYSEAVVLVEEVVDGASLSTPEFSYVLDVETAKEVLAVWSLWRDGAIPTPAEAADAVLYYSANDAYPPAE